MVVGFDVEAAERQREQHGCEWIRADFAVDVGRVHDARQAHERGITGKVEFVDQNLECAFVATMVVLGTSSVEAVGSPLRLHVSTRSAGT